MRLVDADALIPMEVHTIVVRKADGNEVWESVLYAEQIDNAPTIDAEPIRHGRWIKRTKVHPDLPNDSTYNYECSDCSYMDTHGANVEVPYCWHCGAKMDEEEE